MLDEIKRAYYESGKLKEETRYSGGKKNGPCRQYDENGILVAEQNYKDDVREGRSASFYANGNVKSELFYEHGEPSGVQTDYYDDGSVYRKLPIKNGYIEGLVKMYAREGFLAFEAPFHLGIVNGIVRRYDKKDLIVEEVPIYDHKVDGVRRVYREGKLYAEERYNKGKRDGFTKIYGRNNLDQYLSLFVDDEYCGSKAVNYYENGNILREMEMDRGMPDGVQIEYHENGTVAFRLNYRRGMPIDGEYEIYDEYGNYDGMCECKNGHAFLYDVVGNLVEHWVTYRGLRNGLSEFLIPEKRILYCFEGKTCESLEDFLEKTFDKLAERWLSRFSQSSQESVKNSYRDLFRQAYYLAKPDSLNSLDAPREELERCNFSEISNERYADYVAREFSLRLGLASGGEVERRLAMALKKLLRPCSSANR